MTKQKKQSTSKAASKLSKRKYARRAILSLKDVKSEQSKYVRNRSQSKQENENQQILFDLRDNKKDLQNLIDNNEDEILSLERKNEALSKESKVNHIQIFANKNRISNLKRGIEEMNIYMKDNYL